MVMAPYEKQFGINIKKEIDMLEQKSNTVLDLTKLRLAATESARYYRAKLDDAGRHEKCFHVTIGLGIAHPWWWHSHLGPLE